MPTIMAGLTQCIMLSLSMVVIAALVGADGLGKPVVRALNTVNIALGFEAGLAIVLVAIMLDRVCKQPGATGGGLTPCPPSTSATSTSSSAPNPAAALPLLDQGDDRASRSSSETGQVLGVADCHARGRARARSAC